MSQPINVMELLRDPSDIRDLLLAYGEEVPNDDKEARDRLLRLIESVSEIRLIDTLFQFARGFANMLDNILTFCDEKDIRIHGQIQLAGKAALGQPRALQTTWAQGGRPLRLEDLDTKAQALAAELSGMIQRVDILKHHESKEELTDFGQALKDSPDPEHRIWLEMRIGGTHEHVQHDSYSEVDFELLQGALSTVREIQASFDNTSVYREISGPMAELEMRLSKMVAQMNAAKRSRHHKPNPWVVSLSSELYLIAMQWRSLVEEATEGRRVKEGFCEFVRSEFWFQRWRIYELWLLVRVLRTLENSGGVVKLASVDQGIWNLPYGRSIAPVAKSEFSSGVLQIYYQYWRKDKDRADMPDLVVGFPDDRPILVLDPKHSLTYERPEMEAVLRRYARNLLADITGVVNYFPRSSYQFQDVRWDTRQWILASNVAPGTSELQRFELRIAEALLARDCRPAQRLAKPDWAEKPKRHPAKTSFLFYWAQMEREVDEPAGPWILTERGGPRYLPKFSAFLGMKGTDDFVGVDASVNGEACVIRLTDNLVWLLSDQTTLRIPARLSRYSNIFASWNRLGTYYALDDGETTRIFNRTGEQLSDIAHPHPSNEADAWGMERKCLGWSPDGKQIYRADKDSKGRVFVYRLRKFESWEQLHVFDERPPYRTEIRHWRIFRSVGDHVELTLGGYGTIPLDPNGKSISPPSYDKEEAFSVSPSGYYLVEFGPPSLRPKDGVSLLRVVSQHAEQESFPFVRFFGKPYDVARWSNDESRFAFLTRDEDERRRPREERLMVARVGDRNATPVALPGQNPQAFAWLNRSLVEPFL